MKGKLLFFGQFAPTITGQSVISEQMLDIFRNNSIEFEAQRVDFVRSRVPSINIVLSFVYPVYLILRAIYLFISNSNAIVIIPGARSYYGLIRTSLLIRLANFFRHRIIVHFFCGEIDVFLDYQKPWYRDFVLRSFRSPNLKAIVASKALLNGFSCLVKFCVFDVLSNGINLSSSPVLKETKNSPLLDKETINKLDVIYMSNFIESKGYLDLISAVDILVNQRGVTNIYVSFYGQYIDHEDNVLYRSVGDYKEHVENILNRQKLNEYITFFEPLFEREMVMSALSKNNVFVLPTYYSTEAQPMSILEAMSQGLVVISTNYRSISDMIINNETGFFVNSNAPDEIADRLEFLLNNPQVMIDVASNARGRALKKFSLFSFESELLRILSF